MGREMNIPAERTGREGMVLLLGLSRETNGRILGEVREFLKEIRRARCRKVFFVSFT